MRNKKDRLKVAINTIKMAVQELPPYKNIQYPCVVKLNQNEPPFEIPDSLKDEILEEFRSISWSRYPSIFAELLVDRLALYTNCSTSHILVGNGSNELIQTIAIATIRPNTNMLVITPGFYMYPVIGKILEANIYEVPLNSDFSFNVDKIIQTIKEKDIKTVFISSPNNPTGSSLDSTDIAKITKITPGIVILDEAYSEFHRQIAPKLIDTFPNLIILRTFSKAFQLAGLRIGYLLANPELVIELKKAKLPYSVNILSQIAARRLLIEEELLEKNVAYIIKERNRVFNEMSKIPGIRVYPSNANFILFRTKPHKQLFNFLFNKGILIRDVSNYPFLENAFRVTIGKEGENTIFLKTLNEFCYLYRRR